MMVTIRLRWYFFSRRDTTPKDGSTEPRLPRGGVVISSLAKLRAVPRAKAGRKPNASGGFGKEFDFERRGHESRRSPAGEEFAHGATPFVAVIERPAVHVHADELVGELGVHVAGELHGVLESRFAVPERIADALPDDARHLTAHLGTKSAANRVCAERQRQARLFLPPLSEINHAVQSDLRKEQLSFVNEEAGFHFLGLNRVENLVERHRDDLDVRLEEFQGEIRRGQGSRNGDSAAGQFVLLDGM